MKSFFLLILLSFSANIYAQQAKISGIVRSESNVALAGASVVLENTASGVVTNQSGEYVITNVSPGKYTLQVSYTGYVTQKSVLKVNAGDELTQDFLLEEDNLLLGETVISSTPNKYKTESVSGSLRLESRLTDIAQNIVVVDKNIINDQQIFNVLDGLNRNVSGVRRDIQWDNAYAVLNIRGSRISGNFRNGILMFNYLGPLPEDMSYVEKVEFIKGPGSFMIANNEPGGFYNVVTKKPTGAFRNELGFSTGSFKLFRGTGDFDGTIGKSKKLLYRVNVMAQHKGSWIDKDNQNRYVVAPVLTYKITDKISITGEYVYQHLKFAQMAPYAFSSKAYKDLPISFYGGDPSLDPNKTHDHTAFLTYHHIINDKWKLNAQAAYANTRQRGQYLWPITIDQNGNATRAFYLQDLDNAGYMQQLTVNGTIRSGAVTQKILIGADAGHKTYYLDHTMLSIGFPNNIYQPVYGVPVDSIPDYNHDAPLEDRANYRGEYFYSSIYVHDEVQLFNEKLRITVGGRFSHTNKKTGSIAGIDPTVSKNNVFTPRVAVSGTINKYLSAYGLYDVAFVEQQGSDYYANPFEALKGTNLEAGLKANLFKEKMLATVAYYNISKKNALTTDAEHPGFMRQSGKIDAQGIEIDIVGQIVDGLNVTVNYAFTDSKITEDTDPLVVGTYTPGTARHITNGWIQYQLTKTRLKGLGVSFGYQYQAKRYVSSMGATDILPDNYFRLDAGISWTRTKYKISLLANNLLNEYLYTGSLVNLGTGKQYYWQTEAPRSFVVNVAYRF